MECTGGTKISSISKPCSRDTPGRGSRRLPKLLISYLYLLIIITLASCSYFRDSSKLQGLQDEHMKRRLLFQENLVKEGLELEEDHVAEVPLR